MTDTEALRHYHETAYWWRECHGNPALIREMLARVAKRRSAAAVEKLRAGLMEIYRREHG